MKIKWYKDKQLVNVNPEEQGYLAYILLFEKLQDHVHGFHRYPPGRVSQGNFHESMNLSFSERG